MKEEDKIYNGTLIRWTYTFGFIKIDGEEKDVFVHISDTIGGLDIQNPPKIGDRLSFKIGEGLNGKTKAVEANLIEDKPHS